MILRDEAEVFIASGEQHPAIEFALPAKVDEEFQRAVPTWAGPGHAALHIARQAG